MVTPESGNFPIHTRVRKFRENASPRVTTSTSKGVASCNLSLLNELRVLLANSYTATFTATGDYLGTTATTKAIVF
jgi:hypothetical protein